MSQDKNNNLYNQGRRNFDFQMNSGHWDEKCGNIQKTTNKIDYENFALLTPQTRDEDPVISSLLI